MSRVEVSAVILYQNPDHPKILAAPRLKGRLKNFYSFPGGKKEKESWVQAAIRETAEETGMHVKPHHLMSVARFQMQFNSNVLSVNLFECEWYASMGQPQRLEMGLGQWRWLRLTELAVVINNYQLNPGFLLAPIFLSRLDQMDINPEIRFSMTEAGLHSQYLWSRQLKQAWAGY